jgi:L-asparaginase
MSGRPKVALVGTGGTIASVGRHGLDIQDYAAAGQMLDAAGLAARVPELAMVAEILPVPFATLPSTALGWREWHGLAQRLVRLAEEEPDLAGIVVSHGTSAMEETAYALSLMPPLKVPVVLTGAQRPISALSSDGGMNLVNAARVAADPGARGMGVLLVMNDEIHAAREVTKTSNGRLQTFRSPDFGALGHADGDAIAWYRRPVRSGGSFAPEELASPPRVDITYSHSGADGAAVRAFLEAGAQGIVAAGFAPGFVSPAEREALAEAVQQGCVVVLSSRAGSGRVFPTSRASASGFLLADNLLPQKARILLALALGRTRDPGEITRIFAEC